MIFGLKKILRKYFDLYPNTISARPEEKGNVTNIQENSENLQPTARIFYNGYQVWKTFIKNDSTAKTLQELRDKDGKLFYDIKTIQQKLAQLFMRYVFSRIFTF